MRRHARKGLWPESSLLGLQEAYPRRVKGEITLVTAMARITKVTELGQLRDQVVQGTTADEEHEGAIEVSSQEKSTSSDLTRPRIA